MSAARSFLPLLVGAAAAHPALKSTPQVAAAWMYIAETEADWWFSAPFSKVDVLYIGPAGIQQANGGTFGLLPSLESKFAKVASAAREANPAIKILVSQWWGEGQEQKWGESLAKLGGIDAYAHSVAAFVEQHGLDGFDIDYEGMNAISSFPALASALRSALDSRRSGLLFTISPASTEGLTSDSLKHVDYINMQSYAGGIGLHADAFTRLGFPSASVVYGICPESLCSGPSLESACSTVKREGLGGIHLWRLNSDNHDAECETQERAHQLIHSGGCSNAATTVLL